MNLLAAVALAGHTLALHVKLPGNIDPRDVTLTVLFHPPDQFRMKSLLSRKLSESDVMLPRPGAGDRSRAVSLARNREDRRDVDRRRNSEFH